MNRNILTILGYSSSLLLTLLSTHPAQAILPSDSSPLSKPKMPTAGAPISQEDPLQPVVKLTEAKIKQFSLANFGCDCVTCMNSSLQMLQQGSL